MNGKKVMLSSIAAVVVIAAIAAAAAAAGSTLDYCKTGLLQGDWCGGANCGSVGGSGCGGRPGGGSACCTGALKINGRICNGTTITDKCKMPSSEGFSRIRRTVRNVCGDDKQLLLAVLAAYVGYRLYYNKKMF